MVARADSGVGRWLPVAVAVAASLMVVVAFADLGVAASAATDRAAPGAAA